MPDTLCQTYRRLHLLLGTQVVTAQTHCPALETGGGYLGVLRKRQPFDYHRLLKRHDLIEMLICLANAPGPVFTTGPGIVGQALITRILKTPGNGRQTGGQREGVSMRMALTAPYPEPPFDQEGLLQVFGIFRITSFALQQ